MTVSRPERLLPFACVAAALVLFASDLMTTFEVSVPVQGAQCVLTAPDRHHYALAVLAVFAIGSVLAAVSWGSKPAAIATACAGVIALLLFLTVDLPDATATGTIGDTCTAVSGSFASADITPQPGFWLELLGALGLALTGAALATLTPEQLGDLAPRRLRREEVEAPVSAPEQAQPEPEPSAHSQPQRASRRKPPTSSRRSRH